MRSTSKIATPRFDRIATQHCLHAKLSRLYRMVNAVYESKFRPFGLQGSMVHILFIIGKKNRVHQKTIADILILDQSTMSRAVKQLIKKGLIRTYKGEDPRYTELELTPKGYDLVERVAPVWEKIQSTVESVLGKFNIQNIETIQEAFRTHLDEIKS